MAYSSYLVGAAESATGVTNTLVIPVGSSDTLGNPGSPTGNGDGLVLTIGYNGAGTIGTVTDTQGNTWALVQSNTTSQTIYQFACPNAAALSTSDSVSVPFSITTGEKYGIITAATGSPAGWVVDTGSKAIGNGTGTAPSVTSGTLAQAVELIFAGFQNTSGGGSPVLTGVTRISQVHVSGLGWTTVAGKLTSVTTAVTAAGTIASTSWAAMIFGLIPNASFSLPEGGGASESIHVGAVFDIAELHAQSGSATARFDISELHASTQAGGSTAVFDVSEISAVTIPFTGTSTATGISYVTPSNGYQPLTLRTIVAGVWA